ncbi:MAG: Bis(5'-nucleosyl)-tetraphosphatase, symmetrical [Candidatus Omnitrophica bacterium]|nr:Bis(5'-nucleosyl)-tetraphosphatase, symmetrical [Candidatus Omnitrophota bacterium]
MARYVVGDIHGAHKALVQCLERASFNKEQDLLISLGDICDGWPEVHKVMDELLSIPNRRILLGNHDQWSLRWMQEGWKGREWTTQGGQGTLESYGKDRANVPPAHRKLIEEARKYLEIDGKLFVHAGVDPTRHLTHQDEETLLWDRDLVYNAARHHKTDPEHRYGEWTDIFVGHTTTLVYKTTEPMRVCNIRALDTGAGWSGKLTLMDIDTYAYWQSDPVPTLYPGVRGRR